MDVNVLVAQARAAYETTKEDQTEVSSGTFEYETPPEGFTPARFIGYIELGTRKQRPYQGKAKPDAEDVRVVFELNGPKHQREVEIDGEKKVFTNTIAVTVTKKLNEKASYTKLFRKMLYGRPDIKHMGEMLGEAFLIQIVHNENEKEGKKRVYANMKDADGNWLLQAPVIVDPISNESKTVPVPEPTQDMKFLLWDAPTQEQWDSLFIDGTRTMKDENGNEREVSKNWLQEEIVTKAVNFQGSPLQALIGGIADLNLEPEAPAADDTAPEAPAEAAPEAPATTTAEAPEKPADEAPAAPTPPAADVDDLMAQLGLNEETK